MELTVDYIKEHKADFLSFQVDLETWVPPAGLVDEYYNTTHGYWYDFRGEACKAAKDRVKRIYAVCPYIDWNGRVYNQKVFDGFLTNVNYTYYKGLVFTSETNFGVNPLNDRQHTCHLPDDLERYGNKHFHMFTDKQEAEEFLNKLLTGNKEILSAKLKKAEADIAKFQKKLANLEKQKVNLTKELNECADQ